MAILETLRAFGQKSASANQVMRALCEHAGWFAPVGYACAALKTNTFDNVTLWGNEARVNAGSLYLFTDAAAGHVASAKVQLGPYASPLSGAELFAFLPAGLRELYVNPGSPQEHGWYMADRALELGGLWGQAVRLERLLSGESQGDLAESLFAFSGWTSFALPNGSIATAVGAAGLKNPAMIFTAPDCVDLALQNLGAQASTLQRVTSTGEALFGAFPRMGVDGFLINPFGPGPCKVFETRVVEAILGSLEARLELRAAERLLEAT